MTSPHSSESRVTSSTVNLARSNLACSLLSRSGSDSSGDPTFDPPPPPAPDDPFLIVLGVVFASTATHGDPPPSELRNDRESLCSSRSSAASLCAEWNESCRTGVERKWGFARDVSARRDEDGNSSGRRLAGVSSEREPHRWSVVGLVLEAPAERSLPLFDELNREKKEGIPDVCCCFEEASVSSCFVNVLRALLIVQSAIEQRCFCTPPSPGRSSAFSIQLVDLSPDCKSY